MQPRHQPANDSARTPISVNQICKSRQSRKQDLTGKSPKPHAQPARPSPHSSDKLRARRQDDLSSSATQDLLDDSICHDLRVDDCHSGAVDLPAVGSDHGCCGPGWVHAGQFDFWRVVAVGLAAELGVEAFVEGERGGFGHAVGDHASVRGVLVGCLFGILVFVGIDCAGACLQESPLQDWSRKVWYVLHDCQYLYMHGRAETLNTHRSG